MMQWLKRLWIKKLDFTPIQGEESDLENDFYLGLDGNVYEVFEGVWT